MGISGREKIKDIAEKTGAVLFALLFWQLASMLIDSSILIAAPTDVLRRLLVIWKEGKFADIIGFTFLHITAGYALGVITAAFAAALASRYRLIEVMLTPWTVCFRTVPVASMVVILLIWVSARNLSVIISFLVVFPVVYNNILTGLKSRSVQFKEMAELFDIRGLRKFRYIILPELKPYIMSACTVTSGMAWKAGAAAEVIGTPPDSIGKMLYQSKIWLDTEELFAWTLILVVLSVVFERLIAALLGRLMKY